jgi:hypothetical protein
MDHNGAINCGGVSRLELRGPLLQDVWISDAFLLDGDGRNVNLVSADAIKNAHTFRLVIGTCENEVSWSTAQLEFVAVEERGGVGGPSYTRVTDPLAPLINDIHRSVRKPRHYLFREEFQGTGRDHRVHPRKL